jgi:hypothetical protein
MRAKQELRKVATKSRQKPETSAIAVHPPRLIQVQMFTEMFIEPFFEPTCFAGAPLHSNSVAMHDAPAPSLVCPQVRDQSAWLQRISQP